jgi:Domain of unknown function (DUF5668)
MEMNSHTSSDDRGIRTLGAIALIVVGGIFLASNVFGIDFDFWDSIWPLIIIAPGVLMLAQAFTGGKNSEGFVYPGSIITGTGLILLYQNITGHWESWSYLWALYPVFIGLALTFHGRRTNNHNNVETGHRMVTGGLVMLLIFGAFFEVAIFDRFGGAWDTLLPLGLIGAGAYLLFGKRNRSTTAYSEKAKIKNDAPSASLQQRIDEALADETPQTPEKV